MLGRYLILDIFIRCAVVPTSIASRVGIDTGVIHSFLPNPVSVSKKCPIN